MSEPVLAPDRRPAVVHLPDALIALFPGAPRHLDVAAASVAEVMDALDARWPGMRDRLCDSRPAVRRHINVFVDGERAGLETPLGPGAEVFILTAISGGRPLRRAGHKRARPAVYGFSADGQRR